MESALFFYNNDALVAEVFPEKPIGILFLTSLRDIALEEFNGQSLKIEGEDRYLEGIIEKTLEETQPGGLLHGLIEVKGVIVDDTESDLKGRFPLLPMDNNSWIFPTQLLSHDCIWNIPSLFRKLPKEDVAGRKKAKYQFENFVFNKALEIGADIIVSDSYMARIDYLQTTFGMYGKVLNIHPAPAIADMLYCFRGKDEVMDAIRFASKNNGSGKTGATLHFINSKLDDGFPIAYICNTNVSANDTEISLLFRNYQKAKLPIFVAGLKHYVLKIFPYL